MGVSPIEITIFRALIGVTPIGNFAFLENSFHLGVAHHLAITGF
jgi:hypothetical protein